MTIDELTELLSEYPPDTEVKRWSDEYGMGLEIMGTEFEPAQPTQRLGGVMFGPTPATVILR